MKFLKSVKKIFFKVFGKAWWFLIALGVLGTYIIFVIIFPGLNAYLSGIRYEGDTKFIREFEMCDNEVFSVNDNGTAILAGYGDADGAFAVFNLEDGETYTSKYNQITVNTFEDDYFTPSNMVITDDNVIYGVRPYYFDPQSSILEKEAVVRISDDYEYIGTSFEIDYDTSIRQRYSKLSRLHYYDGAVTFASIEGDGVWLYSIDTESQVLTKSDFYPTDPDGTYTYNVIPLDGSFLFIRSDGNVYLTGFDEPLGESIYHFDIDPEGLTDHPCFDIAAMVNGKVYIADSYDYNCIYQIDNGELKKVVDIDDDYFYVLSLDSYRFEGDESDSLLICLDNGILAYSDGELYDYTPVITFSPTFLMVLDMVLNVLFQLTLVALFINLIIRKKTLLYKQLIVIIPICIIIISIIASAVFSYSDDKNAERINKDLTVICDLAKNEFEGFDFTALMSANENSGRAYWDLVDKFDKIGSEHGHDWSHEYVFSIVYRSEDGDMVTVARDDSLYLPMYFRDYGKFQALGVDEGDGYTDSSVMSFFEDYYADSNISVYGKIEDKDNSGKFYLRVSTDNSVLYEQRNSLLGYVAIYSFLGIGAIVLLIVFSSLNIIRIIKKATKTVREISGGNLSARVNYKSKDELGQICSEVNAMGQSLETLFEEKDKTEKFYYKFVPEKFRELLGKDNFTDLALGDAKSCELTVLFCDIRGFSINSEMMTAKENFAFANIIYGKMGPIVRNNNGFVDKYIGDAVMGLFESADDAVRCGIEMYRSIVLDPKTAEELKVSDINIGIGIHTGMAMVGIVGESERLSGTVISDTVNMSSRLESLTKQYHTAMLVSKSTIDRMKDPDSLDLRYLGIVQVAGVNEVEALYEVLDCLPDGVREKRSSNNRDFREAIRLFALGRRAEAADALKRLEESGRNDYVSDLYLNYISNLSDDDKANVFRFVRK